MFSGVVVEVAPQLGGKNIFLFRFRLQQALQTRHCRRIKLLDLTQRQRVAEGIVAADANQHDTLAVLRQKVARVDDFRVRRGGISVRHVVAQLVQRRHNDGEGTAFIVAFEIFDILQHEDRRLFGGNNARHVEK